MDRKWAALVALVASTLSANANPKGSAASTAKASLPSKFYMVTRQCKQLVAEIGSSYEATQGELVGVTSAVGYISMCMRVKQNVARCISRLEDKEGTFVSSGSRDVESLFIVVVNKPPLVLMQDVTGENAMYINTQSGDAILTSREYFKFESAVIGGPLAANNKFCKAKMLSEADMKASAKTK